MDKQKLKDEIEYLTQSGHPMLGWVVSYKELMVLIDNLDDTPTTEQAWEKIADKYDSDPGMTKSVCLNALSAFDGGCPRLVTEGHIRTWNPDVEKPEIPKKIADKIEFERALGRTDSTIYSILQSEKITSTWGVAHKDKLMQALVNGYTVKEPIWVVKDKDVGYFVGLEVSRDLNDFYKQSSQSQHQPLKFTDKQKAEAVAMLVDGEIEEWSGKDEQ